MALRDLQPRLRVQERVQGGLERRTFAGALTLHVLVRGPARLTGPLQVDLVAMLGRIGQHHHVVRLYLDEAAADGDEPGLLTRYPHLQRSGLENR
jgi:hypothetical protein